MFPKVIAAAAAKKAEEEAAEAARLAAEEEEAARKAAEEAEAAAAAQMNGHPESLKNPALDGLMSGAGMCGHLRVRSVTECKQTNNLQVPEEGHTKVQEEARLLPSPLEELKDVVLITVMTSAKKPQLPWSSTMNLNQFSIWVSERKYFTYQKRILTFFQQQFFFFLFIFSKASLIDGFFICFIKDIKYLCYR